MTETCGNSKTVEQGKENVANNSKFIYKRGVIRETGAVGKPWGKLEESRTRGCS